MLDKKYKCVNFSDDDKRLTHLNTNEVKIDFLLDLFDAGFQNAYVSLIDNTFCNRIEIVLPNVGCLSLHQTFDESSDIQIPQIDVFYSVASEINKEVKITNIDLSKRATKIVYKIRKYFESHPEYFVMDKDLMKRAKNNQKLLQKQHNAYIKKRYGVLQTFVKEK